MDTIERAQVRLLLEHLSSEYEAKSDEQQKAMHDQPASAPLDQEQPQKNKGGKPLAGHWDDMWSTIAIQLYVGDLQPLSQADIERVMLGWFADRNLEIGETAIRERARQLWRKYEAAK